MLELEAYSVLSGFIKDQTLRGTAGEAWVSVIFPEASGAARLWRREEPSRQPRLQEPNRVLHTETETVSIPN